MNDTWAVRQEIARRLETVYPTWRVWITETLWWGTRKTAALPPGGGRADLSMTVCANTPEELRHALDEQSRRWARFVSRPLMRS